MASLFSLASLPSISDFFPPTPQAYNLLSTVFKWLPVTTLALWTPLRNYQAMGKTSSTSSKLNLPGRYAWSIAESVGPFNMLYVLYTLPAKLLPLNPVATTSTSLFGTGLPLQHEILGFLYVLHYINRAGVTPLLLAPSMSPIHVSVSMAMAVFQYMNSANLAGWIVYSALQSSTEKQTATTTTDSIFSLWSVVGMTLFTAGLAGNIVAENTLFKLRTAAAKRKAKSEGKAELVFDKVYVIPPAEGLFQYVLFPHYSLEWIEWLGYYILGGAWGLGWKYTVSGAAWFLANEIGTMAPRAWTGVDWYSGKFGKRAVAGRVGTIPGLI